MSVAGVMLFEDIANGQMKGNNTPPQGGGNRSFSLPSDIDFKADISCFALDHLARSCNDMRPSTYLHESNPMTRAGLDHCTLYSKIFTFLIPFQYSSLQIQFLAFRLG